MLRQHTDVLGERLRTEVARRNSAAEVAMQKGVALSAAQHSVAHLEASSRQLTEQLSAEQALHFLPSAPPVAPPVCASPARARFPTRTPCATPRLPDGPPPTGRAGPDTFTKLRPCSRTVR